MEAHFELTLAQPWRTKFVEPGPRIYAILLGMRAIVLVVALLATLSPAQELNPDQLLKAAINAQQNGDFQTAILDYRKILELRPDAFEAKVNLGAALVHVGQFDAAITVYQDRKSTRLNSSHDQ